MTLSLRHITISLLAQAAASAMALTPDEARELFAAGEYEEAAPALAEAARREPRNAQLNQMAGIALFNIGRRAEAAPLLRQGQNESNLYLAKIAMFDYDFDAAEDYLDRYENGFRKGKRGAKPERPEATELREQVERGRSMLDRVEKIAIIDSLDVDAETFFEAFRLSPSSGALVSPDLLPRGFEAADPTVVYVTEKGDNIYWSAPDEEQNFRIATSSLLADNSWEPPTLLDIELNEGGEANYPFLMSDGVTLYFANTGENSLGGYDIFISRRDGDSFLQPQNIGMPYNSYANDYMMAIDEETGVGWWATDRNAAPGRLTVYLFKPSELRINYPVDEPGLADRALARNFRSTWDDGADYTQLIRAVKSISGNARRGEESPGLRLAIPGRGIITDPSQLRSAEARRLAADYMKLTAELSTTLRRLAALRTSYSRGQTAVGSDILEAESNVESLRARVKSASNAVVSAELGR